LIKVVQGGLIAEPWWNVDSDWLIEPTFSCGLIQPYNNHKARYINHSRGVYRQKHNSKKYINVWIIYIKSKKIARRQY